MSSLFSGCFGRQKDPSRDDHPRNGSAPPAGQRKIDDVNPAKCIFCNVTPDRFSIVLQDEQFVCFKDRSPAAAIHLLVIPRTHIANVQSLTQRDSDLVRQMQALGNKALDLISSCGPAPERRFGFHIPPFRSVDHLHLHCLELPFRSRIKALKYRVAQPPSRDYDKGWSWFAEWQQACLLIDAGRKAKVSSC
ncbi:uncharacterized protein SPSC_06434 [Sporisorium scitamineum]|uniref:HIT domain-containing protein n=1 Tax=Sporisorium scitamineum TaxID=49012 RepID=A0A0F7S282_9BASI|nr:hypothetical protein [Sporisorium scitamineum]CDU26240.1 uncharacterized protein SPSC_06434 [Sporisorium scitamineum]